MLTTTSKRSPYSIVSYQPISIAVENSKGIRNIARKSSSAWNVSIDVLVLEDDEWLDDGEGPLCFRAWSCREHTGQLDTAPLGSISLSKYISVALISVLSFIRSFHVIPVIPVGRWRLDTRSKYLDGLRHYRHYGSPALEIARRPPEYENIRARMSPLWPFHVSLSLLFHFLSVLTAFSVSPGQRRHRLPVIISGSARLRPPSAAGTMQISDWLYNRHYIPHELMCGCGSVGSVSHPGHGRFRQRCSGGACVCSSFTNMIVRCSTTPLQFTSSDANEFV
jgi:hypothetical protein